MTKKAVKKPKLKSEKKASSKPYVPNDKEKYMCAKHKKFFTEELVRWKKDIIKSNSLTNLLNSSDDNVSSADMVDQASSYTEKSVEMRALDARSTAGRPRNAECDRESRGTKQCVRHGEAIH